MIRKIDVPLPERVWRAMDPNRYRDTVDSILLDRRIDPDVFRMPAHEVWQWWNGPALFATRDGAQPRPSAVPDEIAELLAVPDRKFVDILLRDAREAENPHLAHDAVVERWASSAPTARAWGRYAVAQAERKALATPYLSRGAAVEALGGAYADLATLNMRAYQARRLHHRYLTRVYADHCARRRALVPDLPGLLHEAFGRLAAVDPELACTITALVSRHEHVCMHAASGCPSCHHHLAAESRAATASLESAPERPHADPATRYALLTDLHADLVWAVADAAIGGQDSATCGWGWAASDGSDAWGGVLCRQQR
ncbi:hypothetical protein [Streptacidiphilus rugosus]|uniref:hypothetical protein n=1 Tax=Streptacidiphilus rugosus TaxID=405783 RepID=UPI0005664AE8|nr:hypothetical protein [Streptacidiphilus rugosus]